MWNSRVKHLIHCCTLLSVIFLYELYTGAIKFRKNAEKNPTHSHLWMVFMRLLAISQILILPYSVINFLGLTLYNAFPDTVKPKISPKSAPFICFRVVTKGDYPDLVISNLARNVKTCIESGLRHFRVEVVTDKFIGIPQNCVTRETVVPEDYRTKSGAIFKARALQYCLEDSVNILDDTDWIVHLDEETLLTKGSVHGILNFIAKGKHQFGQGLVTYTNNIVNWVTTFADCIRVADDMGKTRMQFSAFHKPLFGWRGSFMVVQVGAERQVAFDNGPEGSVIEDCFFAMKAYIEGFSFDFIEGEMWETSAFTIYDFVQQRKRWFQGLSLLVHSKRIPFSKKALMCSGYYAGLALPLSTVYIYLSGLFPVQESSVLDYVASFSTAVIFYMYIYGMVKSFTVRQLGITRFIFCLCGVLLTIPLSILLENTAIIFGILSKKHQFYVIDKNIKILR